MLHYRAYPIGDDGHFLSVSVISAKNDREAVLQAKAMLNGNPVELWENSRLVARLDRSGDDLQILTPLIPEASAGY